LDCSTIEEEEEEEEEGEEEEEENKKRRRLDTRRHLSKWFYKNLAR
jgi:hypothetical protein